MHRVPQHAAGGSPVDRLLSASGLRVIAAAAAVLAVVAIGFGGYRLLSDSSCSDTIHLSVAAAPEIEPAVGTTVQQWLATRPRVADRCVAVDVAVADPADTAAAVAAQHKATLTGLGQPAGDIHV